MYKSNRPPLLFTKESILGLTVMTLFLVMYNIGAIFYQIRGVAPEHIRFSVFGYFLGVILTAFSLSAIERRICEGAFAYKFWRNGILVFLLLPALFSFSAPLVTHGAFSGTLLFNIIQPFLWGTLLPVSFCLFFRYVPTSMQALFFGVAVGFGHLCWALIVTIVGGESELILKNLSFAAEKRYLFFLNCFRSILCVGFAFIAWSLLTKPRFKHNALAGNDDQTYKTSIKRRIWLFLTPLLMCYFINGLMNFLFSSRLLTRGMYPEFMHLFLTVFFPILGLALYRSKEHLLHLVLAISVLLFLANPLLLFIPLDSPMYQVIYFICSVSHQTLMFAGTLVCGRFAFYSSMPALTASALWLGTAAVISGALFASRVQPLLPFPFYITVCVCAVLCFALIPLLRKAFPLPTPHEVIEKNTIHTPQRSHIKLPLNTKEMEILALAAQGHSNADIANDMELALSTVGNRMSQIYTKLGVKNRTQAIQEWNKTQP